MHIPDIIQVIIQAGMINNYFAKIWIRIYLDRSQW